MLAVSNRQQEVRARPVPWGPRASQDFGASQLGQQGVPPRLNYFVSRSITRPEPSQRLQGLSEAQAEEVPAEFADKYVLRRMLGKGSFGVVRSVIDVNTGLEWAAKIMPKKMNDKDPARILKRLREEVRLQSDSPLQHSHTVIVDYPSSVSF